MYAIMGAISNNTFEIPQKDLTYIFEGMIFT